MAGTIKSYDTDAGRRWEVRYRRPDKGTTRKRGFLRKRDAETYLASVTISKATGEYIDPAMSRVTVGMLWPSWEKIKKSSLKKSSFDPIPRRWRKHVEPAWGDIPVKDVTTSEVEGWYATLRESLAVSTANQTLGILAGILDMAVTDKRIPRNPARGLKSYQKPAKSKPGQRALSRPQVELLAESSPHPLLIRLAAYTGLRWGEAVALRVMDVDMKRRIITVTRGASTLPGGVHLEDSTKSRKGQRKDRFTTFPPSLDKALKKAMEDKEPDGLMFPAPRSGSFMRTPSSRSSWWTVARESARAIDGTIPADITFHDLRRTFATLALTAGIDPNRVREMMGHETLDMTMRVYAEVKREDLSDVAALMDAAA